MCEHRLLSGVFFMWCKLGRLPVKQRPTSRLKYVHLSLTTRAKHGYNAANLFLNLMVFPLRYLLFFTLYAMRDCVTNNTLGNLCFVTLAKL